MKHVQMGVTSVIAQDQLLPALPPTSHLGLSILTPMSKTQRASEMACTKVSGSVQPLPTWKLGNKKGEYSVSENIYSGKNL